MKGRPVAQWHGLRIPYEPDAGMARVSFLINAAIRPDAAISVLNCHIVLYIVFVKSTKQKQFIDILFV
jgi:hypothetical protein